MKVAVMTVSVLFVVSVLYADEQNDLKAMQGTFIATIVETGGRPASDDDKKLKLKIVISGTAYKTYLDELPLGAGEIKLDAAKKPGALDMTPTVGPLAGKVQAGIYKIEGNSFHVVLAAPGQARPGEFKTKEGSQQLWLKYTQAAK